MSFRPFRGMYCGLEAATASCRILALVAWHGSYPSIGGRVSGSTAGKFLSGLLARPRGPKCASMWQLGADLANDLTNVPGFLLRKARNSPHKGNVIIIARSRALVQQSFGCISIADDTVVEASWETRF